MKNEQAIRIARNYLLQRMGIETNDIFVKSAAPANGRILVWAKTRDEYGDPQVFEIEIEPLVNYISMKIIKAENALSEYEQEPVELQKLKPGDRFRLQYDCLVWTYIGRVEDCSGTPHIIRRTDGRGTPSRVAGQMVFPLGK